jgi:hypothetical protein
MNMSYKTIGTLTCPHCGNKNKLTFWAVVNKNENPRIAQRVRSGNIFSHKCKHCGKESIASYNTVYEDEENKMMIFYSKSLIDIADAHSAIRMRKENTVGDNCNIRIVDSPNALKEKIRLFELGYDDRIIEIMKAAVLENKCESVREFGQIKEIVCWPVNDQYFELSIIGEVTKEYLLKKELYDMIKGKTKNMLAKEECPVEVNLDFAIDFIERNNFIIR